MHGPFQGISPPLPHLDGRIWEWRLNEPCSGSLRTDIVAPSDFRHLSELAAPATICEYLAVPRRSEDERADEISDK